MHRLPWLVIGLFGGIFASKIVGNFEEVLEKNIILAAFIPLIVYMSDAVGTQMEAFVIRDMAIHHLKFIKYAIRQFMVVIVIAVILSLSLFIYAISTGKEINIALALAIPLFTAIMSSVVSGLFVPYLFRLIKLDPANASGPIATIIQDILSISIYFWIASKFL
jgi:magnesium transporter